MMEYAEFRSIALDDQDVDWFEKKISALDQFLVLNLSEPKSALMPILLSLYMMEVTLMNMKI